MKHSIFCVASLLSVCALAHADSPFPCTVILREGDPVPNRDATVYLMDYPSINNDGDIALRMNTNQSFGWVGVAMLLRRGGTWSTIATSGESHADGWVFRNPASAFLFNSGDLWFADVQTGGTAVQTFWKWSGGTLTRIATSTDVLPSPVGPVPMPSGGNPSFAEAPTGEVVCNPNDTGVVRFGANPGNAFVPVFSGMVFPSGTLPGFRVDRGYGSVLNDGSVFFQATPPVTNPWPGVFLENQGVVPWFAGDGTWLLGLHGGARGVWGLPYESNFNRAGDVVVELQFWTSTSCQPFTDPYCAPSEYGYYFIHRDEPVAEPIFGRRIVHPAYIRPFDDRSVIAETMDAAGVGSLSRRSPQGVWTDLATQGQQVPGMPAGTVWYYTPSSFGIESGSPQQNAEGWLVFQGSVIMPNGAAKLMLFAVSPDNQVIPVLTPGQQIEVAPGVTKPFTGYNGGALGYWGHVLNSTRQLNDHGELTGQVVVNENERVLVLLDLTPPPPCRADFNGDQFLDFTDFDDFVTSFEAGNANSDFNADGFLDFTDFDDFVLAFEAGC